MATYLQGVTDYIPQVQPFAPDINLYANVLQSKQSKYDANWQSLNNVYSQYFYADLSREDNQQRRDELMTAIDFNLKKVSGLDLSLEQNVRQAKQLFTPFYEDKFLMKDMVYTKNYMQERQKGLSLKNARDEKMRDQYWEAGIKALDYRVEEFKNVGLDETLNFGSLSYTPFVNIQKKALDLAKEFGNIETPSFSPDGRYMIVNRNGEQLREPLHRLFEAALGNDPAAQEMFSTLAYVQRKDYAQTNAGLFGGDAKQAEMKYLQEQFENFSRVQKVEFENQQDNLKVINKFISDLEKKDAAGTLDDSGKKALREYTYSKEIIERNLERAEKLNEELNTDLGSSNTGKGFQNPYGDEETLRRKVDAAVANNLFSKQLQEYAQVYAMRNMKQTVTADPYALVDYKHQKSKELANYKARLKKTEDEEKLALERELLGINQAASAASDGGSAGVTEDISNPMSIAVKALQQQKDDINTDLTSIVEMYKVLRESGNLSQEELYRRTGYKDITSLEQAHKNGKLINDYKSFNLKGGINLQTIRAAGKAFREAGDDKSQQRTIVKEHTEQTGRKLDNIYRDTYTYLKENRHITGIDSLYDSFARGADTPYQNYLAYKESKQAYNEWHDQYVKPLAGNLAKMNTIFWGGWTPYQVSGEEGRDALYQTVGKQKVHDIFLNSANEEDFINNLEKELQTFYKDTDFKFADRGHLDKFKFERNSEDYRRLLKGYKPQKFYRPAGLYDKINDNLKDLLETQTVPPPPNVLAYGKMDPTNAFGMFTPTVIQLNAQAKDLTAPGTFGFRQLIQEVGRLGLDDDTFFSLNASIAGKNEMEKYKDKRQEINNVFKSMFNSYLGTKSDGVVNMKFSPLALGSADKHAVTVTFPESYAKDFEKQLKAINEDFLNAFKANGNSITLVTDAGALNNVSFIKSAQYTKFENRVMNAGEKGITLKTIHNQDYKIVYKDGGFYMNLYENGVLLENPYTQSFFSAPADLTATLNSDLMKRLLVW
jgi:hypothetical protein